METFELLYLPYFSRYLHELFTSMFSEVSSIRKNIYLAEFLKKNFFVTSLRIYSAVIGLDRVANWHRNLRGLADKFCHLHGRRQVRMLKLGDIVAILISTIHIHYST